MRILDRFPHPAPAPRARRAILPLFLPFAGCPGRCIFCDQKAQTGQPPAPLEAAPKRLASLLDRSGPPAELAFYGGTFTSLPSPWPERLLELAAEAKRAGRLVAIRCSTRPDAIDAGRLDDLKKRGLDTVELGIQSFDDDALAASRRGYSGATAAAACALVRAAGLNLGIQLMPGLPGHSPAAFRADVARAAAQRPDLVRLYPCLVLEGTPLAELWRAGKYAPWSLEATQTALAAALAEFWRARVPVARIGLAEQEGLAVLAGPRHPALGQIVRSRALLAAIGARAALLPNRPGILLVPRRWRGEILGQRNALRGAYAGLGLTLRLWEEDDFALARGE